MYLEYIWIVLWYRRRRIPFQGTYENKKVHFVNVGAVTQNSLPKLRKNIKVKKLEINFKNLIKFLAGTVLIWINSVS